MDEESRKYAFNAGRGAGHAEAVVAAYKVLNEHDENHEQYKAIMAVIKAINALES